MSMFRFILCVVFLPLSLIGVEFASVQQMVNTLQKGASFSYNLNVHLVKGQTENENVLLLLHGMGSDHRIADVLKTYTTIPAHMISFDFPDAAIRDGRYDPRKTTFGTIQEILPVLYILKKLVVDSGLHSIDLFGFSAGGGALVNTIAVLNSDRYAVELQRLGIGGKERKSILNALHNGVVLLDVPLKSVQELIDACGYDEALGIRAKRYRSNDFEPIDALRHWNGLSMQVLLYFEVPDTILSNRDDALFIERLRKFNANGTVQAFNGSSGGHIGFHTPLWNAYKQVTITSQVVSK